MSTSRNRSRLMFLCVPRSSSTSILKCLSSFFDDSEAWFEPYVTCRIAGVQYKLNTGQDLPADFEGNEAIFLKAAELMEKLNGYPLRDGRELAFSYVKQSLENSSKDIVMAKDMGRSMGGRLEYLPSADSGYRYVFIIRDPYRAIPSYRRAVFGAFKKLGIKEVENMDESAFNFLKDDRFYPGAGSSYKQLNETWKHVRAHLDPNPLIIETQDLLANPKPYLQKICEVGGLEYSDELLQWDSSSDRIMTWRNPGVQKIMGESLSDFHNRALTSSGFHPSPGSERPKRESLTPDILEGIDAGIDYYNEMYDQRYTP